MEMILTSDTDSSIDLSDMLSTCHKTMPECSPDSDSSIDMALFSQTCRITDNPGDDTETINYEQFESDLMQSPNISHGQPSRRRAPTADDSSLPSTDEESDVDMSLLLDQSDIPQVPIFDNPIDLPHLTSPMKLSQDEYSPPSVVRCFGHLTTDSESDVDMTLFRNDNNPQDDILHQLVADETESEEETRGDVVSQETVYDHPLLPLTSDTEEDSDVDMSLMAFDAYLPPMPDHMSESLPSPMLPREMMPVTSHSQPTLASTRPLALRSCDGEMMRRIEETIEDYRQQMRSARRMQQMALKWPRSTTGFSIVCSARSRDHVANVLKTLAEIHSLIEADRYSTKRELYYAHKQLYVHQRTCDRAITSICKLFDCSRLPLHVLSASKGVVFGNLRFTAADGKLVDCRVTPQTITHHAHGATNMQSRARAILVVEKDATFQKLVDEQFTTKFPNMILITAKGYPDICTRQLLRRMVEQLNIPCLALMDADPYGVEIYITYKYGPVRPTAENSNLEVAGMRWIGVFRSEIKTLGTMSGDQRISMSVRERIKIQSLRARPCVQADYSIMRELHALDVAGDKLEIEAISSIASGYLTDVYLKQKLEPYF